MSFKHLSDKMGALHDKMSALDKKIQTIEITKETGVGMVKVTMNGHKKVLHLDIDPELLDVGRKAMLQDLVIATINLAVDDVDEQVKVVQQQMSSDLLTSLI